MKNSLAVFFVTILLLGCETDSKLTFKIKELKNKACDVCPEIAISTPKALGKLRVVETINKAIDEEIIYNLKFDDSINANSIDKAMLSFTKSFKSFTEEFKDETLVWEAQTKGEVSFLNPNITTIILDTYIFTGGAHGYSSKTFLNFDIEKNIELENYQFFKNIEGFRDFAETKFRAMYTIPDKNPINTTGFMFSENIFKLPKNLGFTDKGVQLIYNQYEIASYADGSITLLIPFKEANQFLKENYQIK